MILLPVIMSIPDWFGLRTAGRVLSQRLCARIALRVCASTIGAPLRGWFKDAQGVPMPLGRWHWSISHKRHYAAAVIADHPVGIDVECIEPRTDERLMHVAANTEEWAILGERDWPTFFRIWTAKEAVLKAAGVGLAGLDGCRVVGADMERVLIGFADRVWSVAQLIYADHIVAVTGDPHRIQWRFA